MTVNLESDPARWFWNRIGLLLTVGLLGDGGLGEDLVRLLAQHGRDGHAHGDGSRLLDVHLRFALAHLGVVHAEVEEVTESVTYVGAALHDPIAPVVEA